MASLVNLDALIPREDFEVQEDTPNLTSIHRISVKELEEGFLLNALRKPDFQRETSDWSSAKVLDLIRTFLDGDLVPAVIFWQAGGKVFVIDGAHRLSALLSWLHNDYGDGKSSIKFFQNRIPPDQARVAERTRKLIHSEIGAYSEYAAAAKNVGTADQKIKARLGRMGIIAVPVQWVPAVTAKQAEESFFKINQAATPIDPTELRILKARTSPNAIAARAIMRSGAGHKYWAGFGDVIGKEIEEVAKGIYSALYEPPLNTPIKTLDLPVGGRGYGTLPFIFDLVNVANSMKIPDSTRKSNIKDNLPKDEDGTKTIQFLKNVRNRIAIITGNNNESLGVHPAVYFYTLGGTFQPSAFLATMELLEGLKKQNKLQTFTNVREDFEEFLLTHKNFISQIVHKRGSGGRSLSGIKGLYERILEALQTDKKEAKILASLKKDPDFSFLTANEGIEAPSEDKKSFSRGMKTAAFLRDALAAALRCPICKARMHMNSMQADHRQRKREGGKANLENAHMVHPYCNSTVKN